MAKKISGIYVHAVFLLLPIVFTGAGYTAISEAKFIFFSVLTLFFICTALVCGVLDRIKHAAPGGVRFSAAEWCAAAFAAVCVVSAILSPYRDSVLLGGKRQEGVLTLLLYAAAFFLAAHSGGIKRSHVMCLGAAVCVCAVVSTLQFFGKNPLSLYPEGLGFHDRYIKYGSEFMSTVGSSTLLSATLSLAAPLFFTFFVYDDAGARGAYLLFAAAGMWVLLLCEVSAGLVGAAAALFLALPFCVRDDRAGRFALALAVMLAVCALYGCMSYEYDGMLTVHFSPGWKSAVAALTCAVSAAAALLLRRTHTGRKAAAAAAAAEAVMLAGAVCAVFTIRWESGMLYELREILHGNVSDEFGSSRIRIWKEAWSLFREKPLFGSGPDTYGLRSKILFTRISDGVTLSTSVSAAHCEYLNMLVNTGAFSLLFYIGTLFSSAAAALKSRVGGKYGLCVFAALTGYAVQAIFGISQPVSAPLMWIMMGLSLSDARTE